MTTKPENKTTLLWIGDRAFSLAESIDKHVLDSFHQHFLVHDRRREYDSDLKNLTVLDEYFPFPERQYSVEDLHTPLYHYLNEKVNANKLLIIGDPSELLVQSLDMGAAKEVAQDTMLELLETALEHRYSMAVPTFDSGNTDLLLLPPVLHGFEDIDRQVQDLKESAKTSFQNGLIITNEKELQKELSGFLWHLANDGISQAVDISNHVQLL